MAQKAYFDILDDRLSAQERDALHQDMREYCKLDTYAMLAIVRAVCGPV